MKLERLQLKGLTTFQDDTTLDLASAGPGLVALVGPNGAGKSTLLEAAPASLYKTFPTRPGSLYDHCHGKDAFIESTWIDDGDSLTVRLLIDAVNRKTEGYVTRNGDPLSDGKAHQFVEAITSAFGSEPLFLASVFAAQDKSGNFLNMRKGDRKSLFAELLGLAGIEALANSARERVTHASLELSSRRAVLRAGEQETACRDDLRSRKADADRNAEVSEKLLSDARVAEDSARKELEASREAAAKLEALRVDEQAAKAEADTASGLLDEAQAAPDRIRDQAARLTAALAYDRKAEERGARERHNTHVDALAGRAKILMDRISTAKDPDKLAAELLTTRDELLTLSDEDGKRADLDRRLAAEQAEHVRAEERVVSLERQRKEEAERLTRVAKLRDEAPCTKSETWFQPFSQPGEELAATCPLLAEANEASVLLQKTDAVPDELIQARWTSKGCEAAALQLEEQSSNDDDERRAIRIVILKEREQDLVDQRGMAEAVRTARLDLANIHVQRNGLDATLANDLKNIAREADAAIDKIGEVLTDEHHQTLTARAAIKAASDRCYNANRRHEEAFLAYTSADDAPDVGKAIPLVARATLLRERREEEQRKTDRELASVTTQLDAVEAKLATLGDLRDEIASTETDLCDWRLLEKALGKEGVQALEVDAAAPEVSALTNELLEACYGARFSVSFETLADKQDGGTKEVFDVSVYDGGHRRFVEALSGGERVVISEAVSLALAVFNARKSGVRWETLFRDETAGALDPEHASAYVAMLRRARELGGFYQVIFVSHQGAVVNAADSRIFIRDGRVETVAA